MALMTANYDLIDLRIELNISQQRLADEAGVNQSTISDAESGKRRLRKVNARRIFHAINRLRQERGLEPVVFDAISWNL